MTPEEIKRYLALPEKFRDSRLAHTLGGWQMFDNDGYKIRCPSHHAERLAIASMVVGLSEKNQTGIIKTTQPVGYCVSWAAWDFHGDSLFGTLLAACEAVAKEATR